MHPEYVLPEALPQVESNARFFRRKSDLTDNIGTYYIPYYQGAQLVQSGVNPHHLRIIQPELQIHMQMLPLLRENPSIYDFAVWEPLVGHWCALASPTYGLKIYNVAFKAMNVAYTQYLRISPSHRFKIRPIVSAACEENEEYNHEVAMADAILTTLPESLCSAIYRETDGWVRIAELLFYIMGEIFLPSTRTGLLEKLENPGTAASHMVLDRHQEWEATFVLLHRMGVIKEYDRVLDGLDRLLYNAPEDVGKYLQLRDLEYDFTVDKDFDEVLKVSEKVGSLLVRNNERSKSQKALF